MKKGDFVKIDFVGKVAATGEIFDLTNEELAKKEGIHNDKQKYGPILIIIDSGMTIPGVEKQLEEMKNGEEKEFDVKPTEAFGHRRPELLKIISIAKFFKEKINPVPGAFVTIDNKQAKIQSISGGRVRVDFNHPLASRELHYKLKIVEAIEKPLEKVKAIIDHFTIKCETEYDEKDSKITIKTEKKMPHVVEKLLEDWIKKWVSEIKSINFLLKEKKKVEEKPEIKKDR
ncbi:MAG: peptidylprolyl isomerase [Nanoarchaeota archaeon]|nr:peptidylprolyl isomerase [Nanoarchaeota archaeon]MBU1135206.1 peptidylprolyl isomerase [Nanoarchaeota archaeon]MBU2520481.1 peptidylprolyl isomerase [Nanoarchaeota archaeon]